MSFRSRQHAFITSLDDDELAKPIVIRTRGGIETVQQLCDTMLHVVNHSSYHRGQVTNLVRQVGGTPKATDYFYYLLNRGITK